REAQRPRLPELRQLPASCPLPLQLTCFRRTRRTRQLPAQLRRAHLVAEYLAAFTPPANDEWIVTAIDERDWGWVFSWVNRRRAEDSGDPHDVYVGSGPFLVDRSTGRVALCGSAYEVDHYVQLWRSGQWPDT